MADKSGNGRDDKGRFGPGNPGGPGRPRRSIERDYLTAISEACPLDTWRDIVQMAVERAKAGDERARAWLASYLVGMPKSEAPSLQGMAVDEAAGVDPVERDALLAGLVGKV